MGIVRKTRSVDTILELFEDTDHAFSGVSLIDRLNGQMNKTTVYRILDRLEDEGIIHSFQDQKGLTWYAKCKSCASGQHTDLHPHFQCRSCGRTSCLHVKITIPLIRNHRIEGAELLMTGLCEQCT